MKRMAERENAGRINYSCRSSWIVKLLLRYPTSAIWSICSSQAPNFLMQKRSSARNVISFRWLLSSPRTNRPTNEISEYYTNQRQTNALRILFTENNRLGNEESCSLSLAQLWVLGEFRDVLPVRIVLKIISALWRTNSRWVTPRDGTTRSGIRSLQRKINKGRR